LILELALKSLAGVMVLDTTTVFSSKRFTVASKLKFPTIGSLKATLGKSQDKMSSTQSDSTDTPRSTKMEVLKELTGRVEKSFTLKLTITLSQATTPSTATTFVSGKESLLTSLTSTHSTQETTSVPSTKDRELSTLPLACIPMTLLMLVKNSDLSNNTSSVLPLSEISSTDSERDTATGTISQRRTLSSLMILIQQLPLLSLPEFWSMKRSFLGIKFGLSSITLSPTLTTLSSLRLWRNGPLVSSVTSYLDIWILFI
jgi:hypothetical protein